MNINSIKEKFDIEINDELKEILSFVKEEPIFFDEEKRLLSSEEILNGKEELQLTKDIIPIIDLYDNEYLGYDILNKEFVKFDISDDYIFEKLKSIQVYIDMLKNK